jgi:hypothetical protein
MPSPVYTAASEAAATARFFTDTWGGKDPAIVKPWREGGGSDEEQ